SCYVDALSAGAAPGKVLNNLGLLLQELGQLDEAEAVCRAALDQDPDRIEARVNLALLLLARGDYVEGWRAYESRLLLPGAQTRRFLQPQWTGATPPDGRTILLHAEQGFGDTLQFCRYAPLLAAAGARVLLEVPPALVRLAKTLTGVAAVVTAGDPLPPFDLHCPLMSLPVAFGTTLDSIPHSLPYLQADPVQEADWRQALAQVPGRRIGLVWAGSARLDHPHAAALDRRRSVSLAALAPLAAIPACSFISLQLGVAAAQPSPPGMQLHDPTTHLHDFADTAAVIAALDAVVSVDSAVAHLAGAMGKPVFLLNRFDTCWRWLHGRDDSPWYPTLRQFRQPARHDWATPITQLAQALADFQP
ncbi:MAG: tetratricopeptide repeat protein, partial [Rhodospirillales bacterium]|nr:tetratricopeptide repeat protein [Rhodospirillales bacterium]